MRQHVAVPHFMRKLSNAAAPVIWPSWIILAITTVCFGVNRIKPAHTVSYLGVKRLQPNGWVFLPQNHTKADSRDSQYYP
jgi:hypothetical protein